MKKLKLFLSCLLTLALMVGMVGGALPAYAEDSAPDPEENLAEPAEGEGEAAPAAAEEPVAPTEAGEGGIYRHWDAATGTMTFNNDPEGGTAITALNSSTVRGDVAEGDIKKVVFACDIPLSSGYMLFYNFSNMTSIEGMNYLDTSNATDMSVMFYGCSSLTSLDVSGFNTDNVTDMREMFSGCSGLTSLDVSHFNTVNVTNMMGLFSDCKGLTSLDVSSFNTANVTNMSFMFSRCSSLTSLDVSGFNTSNVKNMNTMFQSCSGLTALDVSGFDTANVTDMTLMFSGCRNVPMLDVSHFNTSNVRNMNAMFQICTGLTALDVSGFDTANVTNMSVMFSGCSGLTSLDVSGFNTANVTNMDRMFDGCRSLSSLDVSGFNTSNVTNMLVMFRNCTGLKQLKVSANFGAACEGGKEATFPVDMVEEISREKMPKDSVVPQNISSVRTYVLEGDATEFTVTFDPNGGSGTMEAVTVKPGEKLKLPECTFTAPEGKEFDRWELGAPGAEVEITADTTVKALWKDRAPAEYTVTFDPNGGSGTMEAVTVKAGEKLKLPECTFTAPEGKEFERWELGAPDEEVEITGNTAVKAVWKDKTQVSYKITKGADGKRELGRAAGYELIVKRSVEDEKCYEHFLYVEFDGKQLTNGTDYSAKPGSTVIELKPGMLNKQKAGAHKVLIAFDDGTVETTLTIVKSNTPVTGDKGTALWTALLLSSAAGLAAVLVTKKRYTA